MINVVNQKRLIIIYAIWCEAILIYFASYSNDCQLDNAKLNLLFFIIYPCIQQLQELARPNKLN